MLAAISGGSIGTQVLLPSLPWVASQAVAVSIPWLLLPLSDSGSGAQWYQLSSCPTSVAGRPPSSVCVLQNLLLSFPVRSSGNELRSSWSHRAALHRGLSDAASLMPLERPSLHQTVVQGPPASRGQQCVKNAHVRCRCPAKGLFLRALLLAASTQEAD